MSHRSIHGAVAAVLSILGFIASATAGENWPQWRGPHGDGHSADTHLPVKWTAADVAWKTDLPGEGQSSPIVWGERIFLTSAVDGGRQRVVFCIDRRDGKRLWEQVAWTGEPESSHKMNNRASSSCATDGQCVVAFFGTGGLHCYDMDGKNLWSLDLGDFPGSWGTGASPLIVDNMVIQNCDAAGKAFLAAFDKTTGKELWRTGRPDLPRGGWSSPVLIDTGQRRELILNGEFGVQAYDPDSGQELWFCKGFNGRGTPTPVFAGGLVCVVNGKSGDVYAVQPGGEGDVTASRMVWHTPRRGSRDLPSPIVVENRLLVVGLNPGIATCYDATSGKELDKIRLEGNFSASPIAANGLVYIPNEDGEVFTFKLGDRIEIVSRNTVDAADEEVFRATPTPIDGQLLLRSDRVLYCIGQPVAE